MVHRSMFKYFSTFTTLSSVVLPGIISICTVSGKLLKHLPNSLLLLCPESSILALLVSKIKIIGKYSMPHTIKKADENYNFCSLFFICLIPKYQYVCLTLKMRKFSANTK